MGATLDFAAETIHLTASSSAATTTSTASSESQKVNAAMKMYGLEVIAIALLVVGIVCIIVIRPYIMLRRRRRMMEEAIRNGTWHPSFGFDDGRKIPLGETPKFWEAFVGKEDPTQNGRKVETKVEWEWDSIQPFFVACALPPAEDSAMPTNATLTTHILSLAGSVRRLFRRTHSPSEFPMTVMTHVTSTPLIDVKSQVLLTPEPQKIRVAVLIAMPEAPELESWSTPFASTPTTARPMLPVYPALNEDTTRLPHLQVGVADLTVSLPLSLQSGRKAVRLSVASTV